MDQTEFSQLPGKPDGYLSQLLARGKVVTPAGEELPLHSHLPLLECQIIQYWLAEQRPRRLLEIGMAYGISTLAICEALAWEAETRYHIVDPFQRTQWDSVGLFHLAQAGYAERVQWHEEASEQALPRLFREGVRFDFAFIDGSHKREAVLSDVGWVDRMLEPGGLVVLDDIQMPGVQAGVEELVRRHGYQPIDTPAPLRRSLAVRVRRLNGMPESRVVGLRKETGKSASARE